MYCVPLYWNLPCYFWATSEASVRRIFYYTLDQPVEIRLGPAFALCRDYISLGGMQLHLVPRATGLYLAPHNSCQPCCQSSVVIMQVSSNNQIYLGLSVLW